MQSGKGVVHLTELESGDYKSICENLYDGIHITDGTGTILFINKAYTRTTGILPEELLGRKVSEIEAEGILYTGSVTERVLAQGKRINSVATIHRLNKEVLVTGTPVFDEEKNIRLVVTNTRDFPELKRLEAQLLALEEKQEKAVQELAYLRSQQAGDKQTIYHSAAMREVMEIVRKVAPTDVTVLITGESGTGKELIANEIYQNSDRCGKPFIKLNCAAIPAELLESELFGYEEGAFTGAKRTGKAGMFELANTGVLLLDEVGDMPMALQAKLLRVLQERSLVRLGGSKTIDLDIRVIAATNKELLTQVRQGRFREDLYYRLSVVPIELKPLRERREDIPLLAKQFIMEFNKKLGKNVSTLHPDTLKLLQEYHWPGNVREFQHVIEHAMNIIPADCSVLTPEYIFMPSLQHPPAASRTPFSEAAQTPIKRASSKELSLNGHMQNVEREAICKVLQACGGNVTKAAKLLKMSRQSLQYRIKRYQIDLRELMQEAIQSLDFS